MRIELEVDCEMDGNNKLRFSVHENTPFLTIETQKGNVTHVLQIKRAEAQIIMRKLEIC